MTDALEKLVKLVPPPGQPLHAPSRRDFDRIESRICITFPEDYKKLLMTCGHGTWQGFWYVYNPAHHDDETWSSPESDVVGHSDLAIMRAVRQEDRASDPDRRHNPIFPEEGGLLPWAFTDNGGVFFWLTEGARSRWPTVYFDENLWRASDPTVYELTCTEIVYGAVAGELPVFADEFGDDYEYGRPDAFEPAA